MRAHCEIPEDQNVRFMNKRRVAMRLSCVPTVPFRRATRSRPPGWGGRRYGNISLDKVGVFRGQPGTFPLQTAITVLKTDGHIEH